MRIRINFAYPSLIVRSCCIFLNLICSKNIIALNEKEGNETVSNCHQLKLEAADSKMRLTDVADTKVKDYLEIEK